jgi:tetratricopeptide (TPR) repeat protein
MMPARYEKGNAAFALGNYAEAAKEYEAAFGLKPDPALLYNAAQAHRLANNKERALLLYQNLLRVYGQKIGNRDEVQRHIATLRQAIEVENQSRTSPPTEPAPVGATPGRPETATTTTTTTATTTTAAATTREKPGLRRSPALLYGGIGLAAGGVALVIVGGVLNALGRSAADEINNPAPGYVFQPSTVDTVRSYEAASIALFAVGGAAAAAGVALIAVGARQRGERPPATAFAPMGPASSVGASLAVSF